MTGSWERLLPDFARFCPWPLPIAVKPAAQSHDRLRHSLALQYIKEGSVSVAQIAWLLGDEGPTSINHAFARWTGQSASEARDENQSRNGGKVSKLGRAP